MRELFPQRGAAWFSGWTSLFLAQQAHAAVVIVAPLSQPAPALGTWMLLLLAALLTGLAVRKLRGPSPAIRATVAVLATMTVFAAIGTAARTTILIDGSECTRRTEIEYNSSTFTVLESDCDAPIRVESIDPECADPDAPLGSCALLPTSTCEEGQVLNPGESCELPDCEC